MSDSTDFGEDKYRFTFTFPSDQTINGKSLKANIPYDFKIKKGSGNTLTLEKAWGEDKDFTKKAGLECNTDSKECSISSGLNLNVKVGKQKKEGIDSLGTGGGKIKMEKDQPGYNQGLKFTITTADVTLTGGTSPDGSGTEITKLEELETYEITEEGGKYYLTRKASRDENIKSSLVLPQDCQLPTTASSVQCSLSVDQLKNINFDGKDANGPTMASGTATLTISKATNTTDFPFGYRFTLQSEQEITIKDSDNKVKKNIPTDFKIKKQDGKPVSLEKAWSEFSFAAKVGLTCTGTTGDECCTKSDASGQLNIKKGNDKKENITSADTTSSKIKVEKDQEGYNQGLKFTVTEGSVTLSGGTKGDGSTDFTTLDEYETYEIKEEGDKYYLTRRDEAIKTIESQLGLKEAGCSLSTSSPSCTLSTEQIKKINFDGKETNGATLSSGTATLTITSGVDSTDFPHGYKFTLKSDSSDITIKSTENVVKQNISTDFKIKKGTSGSSLSLEKAWTMESLGKKVGLSCNNGDSNECSIEGDSNKLRVWQKDKYDSDVKETTLIKGTGDGCSTSGKIKVTKDQVGYNQGFKFKIEDGNIKLSGSTGSDDSNKIHRLGEFETYEIKEEGTEWYLVRKDRADDFIKKELKLNGGICSESEKFPHGATGSTTCNKIDVTKLKNINFEEKDAHSSSWPKGTISVDLSITSDSSLPGGFKFTFSNSGDSDVCLPTGKKGEKFNLQKSDTSKVEYKIKRTGTGESLKLSLEKKDNGNSGGQCSVSH